MAVTRATGSLSASWMTWACWPRVSSARLSNSREGGRKPQSGPAQLPLLCVFVSFVGCLWFIFSAAFFSFSCLDVFLQPCLHLSCFHSVGATAGWCKGLLCFHEFEGKNQSQMFWAQFWSCRQLTLCLSGLRGWTQVPLVQTAWVQVPQVSYGSGLKVATGNCWPTETHSSSRDLSSESPSWLRERPPEAHPAAGGPASSCWPRFEETFCPGSGRLWPSLLLSGVDVGAVDVGAPKAVPRAALWAEHATTASGLVPAVAAPAHPSCMHRRAKLEQWPGCISTRKGRHKTTNWARPPWAASRSCAVTPCASPQRKRSSSNEY